jgi:hypothetical protein
LQHGYFLGGYFTDRWEYYQLDRRTVRPQARRLSVEDFEKSKLNLTDDANPGLDPDNLLFTGHNCHFTRLVFTTELPSLRHVGARMQWF